MGINNLAKTARIAAFISGVDDIQKLMHYRGHSLKRTSASMAAAHGATMMDLKPWEGVL